MAADGTGGGFRLASPATANVLGTAGMVLLLATIVIGGMTNLKVTIGGVSVLLLCVAFAGVGWAVARRQPHNPVGWILLGFAVLLAADGFGGSYATLVYRSGHGALPLGPVALLLALLWAPVFVLLPLAILLFPDGALPSPRWRWVLRAYLLIGACWPVSIYIAAVATIIGHRIQVDSGGDLTVVDYPHGSTAWLMPVQALILPVLAVFWLLFIGAQVASFRRSSDERRQQLKWLLSGAVVTLLSVIVDTVLGTLDTHPSAIAQAAIDIGSLALVAFPIGIGIGILKYRLYDIDRIISRTLGYGIVTGLLVGVYTGLVLLVTRVLTVKTPVAVAAATLAAAALFNPLRRRVQQVVDRRFNRSRYDADRIVAAFAARLKGGVDLDTVHAALLAAAHQALEPEYASVWISQHGLPRKRD